MQKHILIVGGTSGLGLSLARAYVGIGFEVTITGRHDPRVDGTTCMHLDIGADTAALQRDVEQLIHRIPPVHTLLYAAGFKQDEHRIDGLTPDAVCRMVNVGLTAPMLLVNMLKKRSPTPLKVILITSSSQYTPRLTEPLYAATKAGLGMLGDSLGLDNELGKVIVIAPSGMKTPFWDETKDTDGYLEPEWVAQQILDVTSGPFKYKYVKVLRNPARIEVVETHTNE